MAGISELEAAMMELSPMKSKPQPTHVEKVDKFIDMDSAGFRVVPAYVAFTASTHENLPGPLRSRPNLTGVNILYFQGNLTMYAQYIAKSVATFQKISPAFFYIKYYAHVVGLEGPKRPKSIFVRPATAPDHVTDRNKGKCLPIPEGFKWVEQIVEIDVQTATERGPEYNVVEFGSHEFQPSDYLLIDRFALLQGVEDPGLDTFQKLFVTETETEPELEPEPKPGPVAGPSRESVQVPLPEGGPEPKAGPSNPEPLVVPPFRPRSAQRVGSEPPRALPHAVVPGPSIIERIQSFIFPPIFWVWRGLKRCIPCIKEKHPYLDVDADV